MSGLRFENKVAIVTGGCSGIGKACAEILAENGGKVVVFDIQDTLGEKLKCEGPGQIIYIHCDMFKEDQIQTCVDNVVSRFGQLDCIVNNVGMHTGSTTIEEQAVTDFRRILDLNIVSHYAMYKYSLPHIRKTKGSVINISSSSGTIGVGGCPTYCATKGAIIALSKSLAISEAKHGVRVNTICPGVIQTPMLDEFLSKVDNPKEIEDIKKWAQLGRYGQPREIGQACLFLATEATFTTGAELMCTGGCDIGHSAKS